VSTAVSCWSSYHSCVHSCKLFAVHITQRLHLQVSKGNELRFFLRNVPELTHSLTNLVGEGRFWKFIFFSAVLLKIFWDVAPMGVVYRYQQGCTNFPKARNHFRNLGLRTVTWTSYVYLGPTNITPHRTNFSRHGDWRLGFVYLWLPLFRRSLPSLSSGKLLLRTNVHISIFQITETSRINFDLINPL
jgi:hypothetical protein